MSQAEVPESASSFRINDEPLYEVVDGREVELPPMGVPSVWITSSLISFLGPHVRAKRLGMVVAEMLFILDRSVNLRRRPDLAFVSSERWPLDRPIPEGPAWDVIPDVAVEVVSPTDLYLEILGKVREYFAAGVRSVWIVVPSERLVYVYASPTRVEILDEEAAFDASEVIPGFRIQLEELFPPIAPSEPPAGS